MKEEVATLEMPLVAPAAATSDYQTERGKPMPNLTHGAIQQNIGYELQNTLGRQFRIASEVALNTAPAGSTPDLVVYPRQKLNFLTEPAKRDDAPILTVEIQSPSQSTDEMVEKTYRYFEFGVQSCWIVVPSVRGVFVYQRNGLYEYFHHDEVLTDTVLEIQISLSKIFD